MARLCVADFHKIAQENSRNGVTQFEIAKEKRNANSKQLYASNGVYKLRHVKNGVMVRKENFDGVVRAINNYNSIVV